MTTTGTVYLVGAGPGDPELMTVKAQRLIREADAVVYDRLVAPEILAQIPTGITRIAVGKAPGNHTMDQARINELIVGLAKSGRTVVRLKGGDPFIFGRGSEEALYLRRNGVSFEVVPGITAASACSAYAGIPLTHRGLSNGVRLLTGHCREDRPLDIDWDKVADADTTLVIYMGLANADQITAGLLEAGLDAATPAAAIENGTTARQRHITTTLQQLPEQLKRSGLRSPVTLVIGRVASMANELHWFDTATVPDVSEHPAPTTRQRELHA